MDHLVDVTRFNNIRYKLYAYILANSQSQRPKSISYLYPYHLFPHGVVLL